MGNMEKQNGIALNYLRVSTSEQAQKTLPLDTQRKACRVLAEQKGFRPPSKEDIYEDIVSGRTIAGRPALQGLLERCKSDARVKAVIIYDISRLARNAIEYHTIKEVFKKQGVNLYSVNEPLSDEETPATWLMEFILSGFAEFRSRQDGEKISNGLRTKAEGGMYPGYARYGYKNVQEQTSSSKSKRWIEPNENEAPWVTRCHQLFSTGNYTLPQLAKKLESEGMKARFGKTINVSLVEGILKNNIYIGSYVWKDKTYTEGTYVHLVDKNTFFRNQSILAGRSAGTSRKRSHAFLLRSIGSLCGECGSRWTAAYPKRKQFGDKYGRYYCSKKQKNNRVECSQIAIPIKTLEKQFEDLFKKIQLPYSVAEKIRNRVKAILEQDSQTQEKIRTSLLTRIENNRLRQRRLLEKYVDNKVPEELYEEMMETSKKNEITLKQELDKVEINLKETQRIIEIALSLITSCHKAYKKAPNDELRALLARAFFKKVEIKEGGIYKAELHEPFSFLAKTKLKKNPVFEEALKGGDGENRTRVQWRFS